MGAFVLLVDFDPEGSLTDGAFLLVCIIRMNVPLMVTMQPFQVSAREKSSLADI